MADYKLSLTSHATTVIAEREIEHAWLERAVASPDRTEVDRLDPLLTHALRRVPERDDRVLRVVYNANISPPLVITAYFDRRQRGKP
jgi:hypothetical protein